MRVSVTSVVSVVVLSSAACNSPETAERSTVEISHQSLIPNTDAGGPTNKHPEILPFGMAPLISTGDAWACHATLMAPRWLLTAGHCVNFSTEVPTSKCKYSQDVERIFLFVPDKSRGCVYVEPVGFGVRPDGTGDDDVALVLLKTPNLSAKPASIAPAMPSIGQTVSGFGTGLTALTLAYVDWAFNAASPGWQDVPGIFESGDSGAPLLLGSGTTDDNDQVWGVNSFNGGGKLEYGSVIGLRPQICQDAYSVETHTWDVQGKPLVVPVGGCAPEQSAHDKALHTHEVITSVCSARTSCCDPKGTWDATCVANACQAYNSVGCLSSLPPGTVDAWTRGTVGTTTQHYPADFNIFALGGEVKSPQHVSGAVAGPGKVGAANFSINMSKKPVGLVAGTDVTLSNGSIRGDIYYGGTQNINSNVTRVTGSVISGTPISSADFTKAGSDLATMSTNLSNAPNQIEVKASNGNLQNGNITLSSTNPGLNVFLIHQSDFNSTHSITLSVPSCSTVIINVDGENPWLSSCGVWVYGQPAGSILWNFYQAKTLRVSYIGFTGSVLAPGADAKFEWGAMKGTLVAKSVDSTSEMFDAPFRGNCLVSN